MTWICVAWAVGGCTPEPTPDSPRAVADALVRAMNRNHLGDYTSVFPSVTDIEAHLDCAGRPSLTAALERIREEAPATLDAWRATGLRTGLVMFEEANAEMLVVSPGDIIRQCVVLKSFEIRRIPVVVAITRGGRTEETNETWSFWRFPGKDRWYYTRF